MRTLENYTRPSWDTVMNDYRKLPDRFRSLVRSEAVRSLREYGCEEIGSSDVNHSIYGLACSAGSIDNLVQECLDNVLFEAYRSY